MQKKKINKNKDGIKNNYIAIRTIDIVKACNIDNLSDY